VSMGEKQCETTGVMKQSAVEDTRWSTRNNWKFVDRAGAIQKSPRKILRYAVLGGASVRVLLDWARGG